ncbi:hypothetical protein MRX96_034087 [Rhipicephalus microplus]
MAAQHRKLAGSSDLETSQHSQELASQRSESTFQGIEFDSSSKAPTEEAVERFWKTSSSAATERHERVPQILQKQETLTLPSVESEEAPVPTSRVPHKKREELQAQVEVVTKPQDEESTDLTSEEALIPKSKQYISPLRTSPQGHHMPEQSVELEEISASSELMIELPERVGSETSMKRSSEGPVGATSIESLATKYASDGNVKQTHLPDVSQSAETKKAPVLATRTSCQPREEQQSEVAIILKTSTVQLTEASSGEVVATPEAHSTGPSVKTLVDGVPKEFAGEIYGKVSRGAEHGQSASDSEMRATIQPEHSDRVSVIPDKIPQEFKEVQQRESELMPEVHGQRTPERTLGGTFASTAEQGAQPTKETTIQSRSNLGDTLRVSPEELEPPPKKPRSEQSADVAPKENDARRDTSPTAITQTATKSEPFALLPYESHSKSHFTNVPSSKAPKARTEDAVSIELSELHSLDHGPVIEAVVAPDLAHSVEHAAPLSRQLSSDMGLLVPTDVGQPMVAVQDGVAYSAFSYSDDPDFFTTVGEIDFLTPLASIHAELHALTIDFSRDTLVAVVPMEFSATMVTEAQPPEHSTQMREDSPPVVTRIDWPVVEAFAGPSTPPIEISQLGVPARVESSMGEEPGRSKREKKTKRRPPRPLPLDHGTTLDSTAPVLALSFALVAFVAAAAILLSSVVQGM